MPTKGNEAYLDRQFSRANRLIDKTAVRITRQFAKMRADLPAEVALDYAAEQLVQAVVEQNPQIMLWIDRQPGPEAMKVAVAFTDWIERENRRLAAIVKGARKA
jgi:hypothetical protein